MAFEHSPSLGFKNESFRFHILQIMKQSFEASLF